MDEYDKVVAINKRFNKALCDVIPGGSEYHNNPERCIDFIKEMRDSERRIIKRCMRERNIIFNTPILGWLAKWRLSCK